MAWLLSCFNSKKNHVIFLIIDSDFVTCFLHLITKVSTEASIVCIVWSVNEGQQRFDSHVDKLMNYIRYWQASGESIKTSIRTRTRIEQLTEEGHYTGGIVAFGYKRVKKGRLNKRNQEVCELEINEEEAAIVRLIFQKYVYEGYGAKRI